LIGADIGTDLAVVKIDAGRDLPFAKLGNSDAVRVGDWVLAIGSPFEFDHTVTAGIISALGRGGREFRDPRNTEAGAFQNFIQTDAAINPGNSGGPLVNMAGEVIGINTAIISETRQFAGLGFALPSNIAVKVYNQLVTTGKVTRGSIGITYDPEPSAAKLRSFGIKNGEGVIVESVIDKGPASKAGLQPDDVITEINGKKVGDGNVLLDVVGNTPIGNSLQVKIMRDGRERTLSIPVADRTEVIPNDTASNNGAQRGGRRGGQTSASSQLGMEIQAISATDARRFGLSNESGVLVASVEPNSAADDAGLKEGDIITSMVVNGRSALIQGLEDFRNAEKGWRSGSAVSFRVMVQDESTGHYKAGGLRSVTVP
jgi:serine protease Do